jgi:hypothetical protein
MSQPPRVKRGMGRGVPLGGLGVIAAIFIIGAVARGVSGTGSGVGGLIGPAAAADARVSACY